MQATPHRLRTLAVALAAAFALPAFAQGDDARQQEIERLRATTQSMIRALADQGLISRERAAALMKETLPPESGAAPAPSTAAPAARPKPSTTVRVPYVPETVRAQIKEEIKNEVMATAKEEGWADSRQVPDWAKRFTLAGDVRVRAQGELFDSGNAPASLYRAQTGSPSWSPDLTNTQTSRQRLTLRARLGVTAKVSDDTSGGIRLTTGNVGNSPTSPSATLGDYGNRLSVGLDRAYLRWEPTWAWRLEAGRMAVPFFGGDLLWPTDLSLDGVAARWQTTLATGVGGYVNAGAFPLQELALSNKDKWLYGLQLGTDWALDSYTQLRLGLAYYVFANIEGQRETQPAPTGALAGTTAYQSSQYPASARQRGNTLINLNDPTNTGAPVWGLASKFRPINLSGGITFSQLDPYMLGVSFDYVRNTGFDLADIQRRAGVGAMTLKEQTTGSQVRLQFGTARLAERGHWQGYVAFRRLQRDAWLDAFTDTTWNLGGTNYQGFTLGGTYAFDRASTVGLRYTSTRNLKDATEQGLGYLSSAPLKIDVIQVEVNTAF